MKRIPTTGTAPVFTTATGPLVSVNPGMPISDALDQAACILGVIQDMAANIGENGLQGAEIFAIQYLAETAHGLVEAGILGLLKQENDVGGDA